VCARTSLRGLGCGKPAIHVVVVPNNAGRSGVQGAVLVIDMDDQNLNALERASFDKCNRISMRPPGRTGEQDRARR